VGLTLANWMTEGDPGADVWAMDVARYGGWANRPYTNVKVREKTPFDRLDGILKLVEQAETEVKPAGGRVLLRYSGTEPKARLLIEGPQQAVLENWSTQICDAIKRQVGA
jgi:phosphomannomutase